MHSIHAALDDEVRRKLPNTFKGNLLNRLTAV